VYIRLNITSRQNEQGRGKLYAGRGYLLITQLLQSRVYNRAGRSILNLHE